MRRLIAVAGTIGLAISGVAVSSAAQAAPQPAAAVQEYGYAPAPIAWGVCTSPGLVRRGAQCGMLEVPLDYDHPKRGTVKIAVSRIKHKVPDAQYQGIMLVNPGGPGGSGLTLSVLGEFVPNGAGEFYDWIGFDPRGVGSSVPALACDGNYFSYNRPNYIPTTKALEKTWLQRSKGYAKACDKAGGELLEHLKTTDTVQDMESIRKSLGEKQINFYGFSYGTYLGQVYATLYPSKVRRMVLDGNVDPRGVWYQANLDQDIAFDKNMHVYFAWIAKHDAVYHLGTNGPAIERLFYSEQKKLGKTPAGGIIGADEWTDIFLQAGYYVFGWEDVASAFAGWVHDGDWATLKALYDASNGQGPGADNGFAIYLGVQCTDVKWPQSWDKWRKDNWKTYAKAPFETWGNAWFNAPCLYWGAKPGKPVKVDGSKAPAILLISETKDAATPYEGSLELRSRFPKSVLLEGVGGTTHAGSLNGVACTDDTIAAYLATGALPDRVHGRKSDKQCDPVPQPDPQPAPAASALSKRSAGPAPADITRADLQKLISVK
jgi:pimeloyl-ACP methyl ester carboxylesterase